MFELGRKRIFAIVLNKVSISFMKESERPSVGFERQAYWLGSNPTPNPNTRTRLVTVI